MASRRIFILLVSLSVVYVATQESDGDSKTAMNDGTGSDKMKEYPETKTSKEGERKRRQVAAVASAALGGAVGDIVKQLVHELVGRNRQEEIDQALAKKMDEFQKTSESKSDSQRQELKKEMEQISHAQSGFMRDGAEINIIPERGMQVDDMFMPSAVKMKWRYKEPVREPEGQAVPAFAYSGGVGNTLLNGCFGRVTDVSDPCYAAKVLQPRCPNILEAGNFIGVGFDGRGDYSSSSRKKSIVQRTCLRGGSYGGRSVPDTMTVHGVYDTNVKTMAFSSTRQYQSYLERKAAVAQSSYMFQEATDKAYGRSSGGFLGLFGVGSSHSSLNKQSNSNSHSHSSADHSKESQHSEHQTYMSLLELSVIRYELFLDEVNFYDLNMEFLQDFLALPQSYVGSDSQKFQDFILRWGTHYIKSAKFGGQLRLTKTKEAEEDESMSAFATRAQIDYKAMFSTYSARSAQYKSSSWFHSSSSGTEKSSGETKGEAHSSSRASQDTNEEAYQQRYSNEALMVEGGDQNIAAVISEMYTYGFKHELVEWLRSIPDYPKPFDFQMAPITDLCEMNYKTLFPNGTMDMGCFGKQNLMVDDETGRKYYILEVTETDDGNRTTREVKRRYCDYMSADLFSDSLRRRCGSLRRAMSVYMEEGPIPSTDIHLPPGDSTCGGNRVSFGESDDSGRVLPWEKMTDGSHFKVVFDAPMAIDGVAGAQETVIVFYHHMTKKWFVKSSDGITHLYDGYNNGGTEDIESQKISVRGLILEYDNRTGLLNLQPADFDLSKTLIPTLSEKLRGATLAKVEYLSMFHEIDEHRSEYGIGAIPCNVVWSNAHRFDPQSNRGACVVFTAVSEGDIFVVFSVIPRNQNTWYYLQVGPQGVVIYKGTRVMKFIDDPGARSLGDPRLFESYFACVHETVNGSKTTLTYGKTADNGEEANVFAVYEDDQSPLHVRFYAFGNAEKEVTIVDARLYRSATTGGRICLGGTVSVDGECVERCHAECKGCHTPGSDRACRECQHYKLDDRCVADCPSIYQGDAKTKKCFCMSKIH